MQLSKEVTMKILETLIERLGDFNCTNDCLPCLELEAEIQCFQHHLKSFAP